MHRPRCPHRVLGGICLQRSRCTSRLLPKYQNNGCRLPRSKPATPQSSGAPDRPCKRMSHVVTVPIPEAYAIHKMIINSERGKKAEKDAHAVENMLPLLDEEKQIRYSARYLKKRKQGSVRLQKPMALQRVSWKSSKPLVGSRLGRASCLV